jgi:hypothetical protein
MRGNLEDAGKLRWSHYNGRLPRLNRLATFRFRKMMVSPFPLRISYGWDALIESMNNPNLFTLGNRPLHVNEAEAALRVMAKESRFSRRILSEMVSEFWDRALD